VRNNPGFSSERTLFISMGALTGAICGWIYWRIALAAR
jgi:hypothetical protein